MFYLNINILKINLISILNIYPKSINNVGIKNLYYPIIFDFGSGRLQKTIGLWNIGVFLKKSKRGTHMSRFIEILERFLNKPLNIKMFYSIQKFISFKLESNIVYLQVCFIYFIKKKSPITLINSYLSYKLTLLIKKKDIYIDYILKIVIPVNNLCPCSKLISIYNAHNQRCYISVFLRIKKLINLLEFVSLIEKQSSVELWSILKRKDEKFVTEFSYKNPKFIEDLIRNIYYEIKKIKIIESYIIKIENFESIHNHNVYSFIKN